MKIGLVTPYDWAVPGGVNRHIESLYRQIVARGHTARIIASASVPADQLDQPDLIVLGKPYPIPASGSIARIPILFNLDKPVKALLAREQFDIVHVHEPLQGPLPLTVLRFSNAANVGTFHAYSGSRYSTGSMAYYYGHRLLKRWFRKLDGKIAVSEAAAEFVDQYFRGYYNIIPNGIDFDRFATPAPPIPELADGRPNILFLGRLEERRKGFSYLLRAFRIVKTEWPEARLVVAGGSDRARVGYDTWARRTGLPDVLFVGAPSDEDKIRYFQSATVYVAPNTGDESFGIVLLEAMAAGRPIVASNIRGFAGVLTHGVEGLLVPPKNEAALAAAIGQLLADPIRRDELARNGRLKARDYSWDRVAERILAYYERILLAKESARESGKRAEARPAQRSRLGRFGSAVAPYVGLRR
ncbi:MAG: GDP-mannose-dependent alpha-(1-2)-phosphatidylinositol mannosyltransferase [Dehalococcoidia bacterium]|nr:MAG: GDP-mannose-dependent alpha-(1-2)-phosphatidylinositol mannosyltransferase [Dehalococcoidia bacterium]